MSVEDLFDAEAALRIAAVQYAKVDDIGRSTESHATRNSHRKALRAAAVEYTRLADLFEDALSEREVK